ncbi:MAG: ABC transporter ATP-binding protein [Proteobacteria bacterium]|nr:ABC transporter ATP-binding protein [Pseudomonadota bacterium]
MLEVNNLTKTYSGVKALDDVSFTVTKGHVVGFLGANGAGKTTTMDIICGCLGSDSGNVTICGFDILDQPIQAKSKIGYLPDVPPLYREMTVTESVTYAARLNGIPREQVVSRLEEILPLLSLTDVSNKLVGSLSKGYRQRVALAHALVPDPEVLVLDEPTEGLDPNQIAQIRDVILTLKSHKAIILSSHILHEVQNLCDQLVIINKGKIVTTGDYESIAERYQGRSYELSVRHYSDAVVEKLTGLDFVTDLTKTDRNVLHFELEEPHHLDQVAELVLQEGYGIQKLAPLSSLEGIYKQATA